MLSLAQNAALEDLAQALYEFLPGSAHPYANQNLSFPAIAQALGLRDCWPPQGNKRQGIKLLLQGALERKKFNDLLKEIVKRGMTHRRITQEQMRVVNEVIARVGYRIPELNEPYFLDNLPRAGTARSAQIYASASLHEQIAILFEHYKQLQHLGEVPRGFAFEKFLNDLFQAFGLAPRGPFRLKGEQIDGSFILASESYLLSARWRAKPADRADLLEFFGTIEGKAQWSRGLFVSQMGFSQSGLDAFGLGRRTNIVGMNGSEISTILQNKLNLSEVISSKVRRAAETNQTFVPVWNLFSNLAR